MNLSKKTNASRIIIAIAIRDRNYWNISSSLMNNIMIESTDLFAPLFKEQVVSTAPIHFEIGNHPQGDPSTLTASDEYSRFNAGDPSAHSWNSEVLERMRRYKPKLIGIDGLSYSIIIPAEKFEIGPPFSDDVWMLLPGEPKQINDQGLIYVVAGDNFNTGNAFNIVNTNPGTLELRNAMGGKQGQDIQKELSVNRAEQILCRMVGVVDVALTGKAVLERLFGKYTSKETSRREFLKMLGIGGMNIAAGYIFGKGYFANRAALAGSEEEKNFYLGVVDKLKTRFSFSNNAEARSALIYNKTLDARELLDFGPADQAAVLFGTAHSWEAESVMATPQKREEAIRSYAKTYFDILDYYYKNFPKIAIPREEAVRRVKEIIETGFILQVQQPVTTYPVTNNLPHLVRRSTKEVKRFRSPSVAKALEVFN